MTLQRIYACPSARRVLVSLALLALFTLEASVAVATGFGDPDRWIDQEGKTVLRAPDFYFEFEVKRLASELKPAWKAIPPKAGTTTEEGENYDDQTEAADLADFDAALNDGTIKPADPAKAKDAHEVARAFLQTPGANLSQESPLGADASNLPMALPAEFPSEFADYHRGAYWFRQKQYAEAAKCWETLLARPTEERRYRSAWAAFMLGRTAFQLQQWDSACAWFQKSRDFLKERGSDPIGLAASSLGLEAQAHLEAERYSPAAKLFLEQLASGDTSAVYSLRDVVGSMLMKNYDLAKAVNDPVLQRVITACAVSGMGPFSGYYEPEPPIPGTTATHPSVKWLTVLEAAGARNVRDADRVAWIAYTAGEIAKATRWLQRANQETTHALWLRAKLLLRDGKTGSAAKLMSHVLRSLPDTPLETRDYVEGEFRPPNFAKGDLALLQFTRGDYLSAMKLFIDGDHEQDAVYLAEGILTTKELTRFLEREGPKAPTEEKAAKPDPAEGDPVEITGSKSDEEQFRDQLIDALRRTLGKRYIRSGQFTEARKWLAESEAETLDEYLALLNKTKATDLSKADRATAFMALARFTQENCHALFEITDVENQSARIAGRVVEREDYPKQTFVFGDKLQLALPVTPGERERLKKNSNKLLRHSLALYVAADHAWSAAGLMPDNDEETARWLNEAGSWLKNRDIPAADRFYQAIERRCANTELGRQAIKRHWFVQPE